MDCADAVYHCKVYAESAQKTLMAVEENKAALAVSHDAILFAVTQAQEIFDSSVLVLATASEMISANKDIIHRLRDYVGELHIPFRISADLTKIKSNIKKIRTLCRTKRSCLRNFRELSSLPK